jgi:hypothetical protein
MLNNMFDGMSIYVCSDLLIFFVNVILPKINKTFVLVSGDSDLCVPREAMSKQQFEYVTENPFLIKWFIQNTQLQYHEKIIQLPIGLDYHTILNNPTHPWRLPNESYFPCHQEETLIELKKKSKPFDERIYKIYVNFTNSSDRFFQRKDSIKNIPIDLLIICDKFIPRTNNWKNMTDYTFILSPFGIGMDCHRTWEALCLGCIPIIRAPNFKKLFEDLPVLNVDSWSNISNELLEETIMTFKNKNSSFNYDKLTLKYWMNKIHLINE